jgi:isopenicillin-N N-acyltransferase like protein
MTIATHVSTSNDRSRRGAEFGEALRGEVHNTVDFYLRLFAESAALTREDVRRFGARVRGGLAAKHPQLVEEIEGIARGAATDEDVLMAVNARSELLCLSTSPPGSTGSGRAPTGPECSHVALLPAATAAGHTLLAQTWDFHPDLYASRVLWTLPGDPGGTFVTFTEAGILAKIGMNSFGVACLLARLASAADRHEGGVPAHLTARLVLERATNAAQALATIYSAVTPASVALTIAGAGAPGEGFVAACECSAGRAALALPDDHGVLVRTNHFLALAVERDLAMELDGWQGSIVRKDFMTRWLRERAGRLGRDDIDELLRSRFGAPQAVCVPRHSPSGNWSDEVETLASACFDLHDLSARFTDGARGSDAVSVRLEPSAGIARMSASGYA